jgi:hypothetical protein
MLFDLIQLCNAESANTAVSSGRNLSESAALSHMANENTCTGTQGPAISTPGDIIY